MTIDKARYCAGSPIAAGLSLALTSSMFMTSPKNITKVSRAAPCSASVNVALQSDTRITVTVHLIQLRNYGDTH